MSAVDQRPLLDETKVPDEENQISGETKKTLSIPVKLPVLLAEFWGTALLTATAAFVSTNNLSGRRHTCIGGVFGLF